MNSYVATAKELGAGDDEEDRGLNDAVEDAGATSNSTAPSLSSTARKQAIQYELPRFTLYKGLYDDNDNDDESTGEDDLTWWYRHQFAYPTLARLARRYLAITASSAASEGSFSSAGKIVTKKCNKLEVDTVDAFVFMDGLQGLIGSRRISQEALGRKDK